MSTFAVEWVFGTSPEIPEVRKATIPAHRAYLREQVSAGKLFMAGPWEDATGALLIYTATDRAELDGILAADPYTPAGIIAETSIREWRPVTGALAD